MAEKTQVKAVEMVRRIRDKQARLLKGKSEGESIAFFRKAGEAARRQGKKRQPASSRSRRQTSSTSIVGERHMPTPVREYIKELLVIVGRMQADHPQKEVHT
jgi:hypothetical protein